jgi:hypothetical protein
MNPEDKAQLDHPAESMGHLADMTDMLYGQGRHATHTREQVGRCVYCSCGIRVQGRLPKS